MGLLGGVLQQFQRLLAEGIGDIDGFARHFGGEALVPVIVDSASQSPEEAGQPAAAQQRVEGIEHFLVAQQLAVIVVADRHGLALAVLDHGHARHGRTRIADFT
ncbi:hypothetical protein D3C72_1594510 [compost metagenome]